MSIVCKLFGHGTQQGVHSGAEYMRVEPFVIDGIGREHAYLRARCPRCDAYYTAGKIHLPARDKERALEIQLRKALGEAK